MHLKLLPKEQFEKHQKELMIWLAKKIPIEIKSQKLHVRIVQSLLKMSMTQKYLKKDIYPHKKDRKLLMTWD